MGRPRKYPEQQPYEPTGKRGDTFITTIEHDGHVAKLGDREYLRIPQVSDIKVEYPDNMFGKMGIPKNSHAVEVLKAIDTALLNCCTEYKCILEMKDVITKYLHPCDDPEYSSSNPCEVLKSDNDKIMEAIAPFQTRGGYPRDITRVLYLFAQITTIKQDEQVTDIWDVMHESD